MSVVFSAHIARVGWSLSGTVVASPRMIGARTRPAICSSWLIQPLLQVAQTALTVVWNGLLVWRYSLDRFSHPDPAAAGWPVRPMRSSQSGSTCSLVIVPLAPQKTQAVAMPWWPQLVLLAGQVGELRGRQTVALVPVLLGGGAHRHERGLQRPHRQGRLVLVRDGRGLAPDDRGKDTTGDLFQLAHPAVVAGRADRLDRCLERPAGLAVLTRPVQPP